MVALDAERTAMTPTLCGRLESRVALLVLVGVPWTVLVVPLLPGAANYRAALLTLAVIAALGMGWELLYHAVQQLRWDRDWPSVFALLAGLPEGFAAVPVLCASGLMPPNRLAYVLHFGSTWLIIWLAMQGPIRVIAPRWRHVGGRVVGVRTVTSAGPTRPDLVRALLTCVLLLAAVGCAAAPAAVSQPVPIPAAPAEADPVSARLEPVSVSVPAIGAESPLLRLGLNADGTLEVPPLAESKTAGWYALGPAPGEPGPAVIVGHVDGGGEPGVFLRLAELTVGADVLIRREDGSVLRFVVDRVREVAKTEFPTAEVYGWTDRAELRLITCGGSFDQMADSYRNNVLVFAHLTHR